MGVKIFLLNSIRGTRRSEEEILEFASMNALIEWLMKMEYKFSSFVQKNEKLYHSGTYMRYSNEVRDPLARYDDHFEITRYDHSVYGHRNIIAIFENGKCLASRCNQTKNSYRPKWCFINYDFKDFVSNTFIGNYAKLLLKKNETEIIEYAD